MRKKYIFMILCVFCMSYCYLYFEQSIEARELVEKSLENTSMLFSGDSISSGDANDHHGWSYYIGERFTLKENINASVGGATISTSRKDNRIIFQLQENRDKNFDYVILHGGINDAMDKVELGKISASFKVEDFDTDTFAGALEEYFYYATTYFNKSRIGYIINYQTPLAQDWGGYTNHADQYFRTAKMIAEKWNIPVLDLYFGKVCGNPFKKIITDKYMVDHLHLNENGYKVITPYVIDFIETLSIYERKNIVKEKPSILIENHRIDPANTLILTNNEK